ncbi:hypothetical protein [Streptomyces sp. NBC_01198]|uniref:hypothetical protein n=1 Tax=Streptomyces sp. NBC_01198 TaxID=2903769 RepID=UPI002E0FE8A5|nr:hypothetical protein OG702_31895 [Streptomyces sp. NBC_01198]
MILDFEHFESPDWDFCMPEDEIRFPGRQPKHHQPHWLIVEDDSEDGFTVEHTDDCIDQYGEVGCDVRHEEDYSGLDMFFRRADVGPNEWDRTDGLLVGRYLIESYCTRYDSYWYGEEYDAGLCLIHPEEAM